MQYFKKTLKYLIIILAYFSFYNINAINFQTEDVYKITIVSSKNYKPTVDALLKNLHESKYNVKIIYLSNKPLKILSTDLVISLGRTSTKKAFEHLFKTHNSEVPIQYKSPALLSVLIPKFQYEKYLEEIKKLKYDLPKDQGFFSAIYREQPISRILESIQEIFPKVKNIGVLISNYDKSVLKALNQETKKRDLNLILTKNQYSHTLIKSLIKTLEQCDILLALPDPNIFNPFTSKGIFVSSFRRGVPVFGYTKTYVDAGAVAAIYSTPAQIAKQLVDTINVFFKNSHKLPRVSSPKYFSLAKNKKILNLLDSVKPQGESIKNLENKKLKELNNNE
tara:strand:- start:4143 stop:5150 length:1008 start_codon:yes stop_codon:yes gene_type:complete